jgi:DNA helicase HerA-like ATPase
LPGTEFEVRLKGVSSLVTHNTAILGILGVGKSSLAFELVERILAEGIKVICVDVTGEYEEALSPFIDREKQQRAEEVLLAATTNGKTNYQRNVEEGGSRSAFAAKLGELIAKFLGPQNETARLLVINPAQFDVWRQDSKMFDNRASMASVSAAEITQMVAEASLEAVTELGIVNSARLCVVLEEAHSLVPEWNSTIAEGDRTASNGTSRAC